LRVIVKLPIGQDTRAIDLRGLRVRPLTPSAPPGWRDLAGGVGRALDAPLEGPGLREIATGRRDAVVVVPDATRDVNLPVVLPEVLQRLSRGGIEARRITVMVACGTHPPVPDADLQRLLGQLPGGIETVQHDARDVGSLVEVGTVEGRPIRVNRRVAEADLLVTIGEVKHHYFAGFGGGPKMVFPGVGGYEEIQANHARVIDDPGGVAARNPGCEPGVLTGNPVAEEIAMAADLRPPDMALSLVPGQGGGPAAAMAGPWRATFDRAVETARDWYEVGVERRFTLAVASACGPPADATLIQGHKALDAACRFIEDGGELLFVADFCGGPGSADMEPFLAEPDHRVILRRLAERWIQYGHTTLRLVEKTARVRVHLLSNLDPDLAERLGFESTDEPREVVEAWRRDRGGEMVAVFPGAPVYPRVV
jgi:nickel-dependent lactate racemase